MVNGDEKILQKCKCRWEKATSKRSLCIHQGKMKCRQTIPLSKSDNRRPRPGLHPQHRRTQQRWDVGGSWRKRCEAGTTQWKWEKHPSSPTLWKATIKTSTGRHNKMNCRGWRWNREVELRKKLNMLPRSCLRSTKRSCNFLRAAPWR